MSTIKQPIFDHRVEDVAAQRQQHGDELFRSAERFSIAWDIHCGNAQHLQIGQPYRLVEGRIFRLLQGTIRATANLLEYEHSAGDVLLLPPNCIIELKEMSPDTHMQILSYDDTAFQQHNQQIISLTPSEDELAEIDALISLIWRCFGHEPFRKQETQALFQALQAQIVSIYETEQAHQPIAKDSRQQAIFRQFLQLVNTHCRQQRALDFCAKSLFVTPHYLSTMTKQVSGVNATQWINRAVIYEAKLLLRYTDRQVAAIAYDLNFPNPAFFNKFFKREVGMTPKEYRDNK